MLIKSALRDLLSVSYGMISILVISRCAAPPYPAAPDFPPKGETTHYDLCVAGAPSNHVCCASTGKRVARFSGRFASLRIVFPCHLCSGGRIGSMLSCRGIAPFLSIHSAPSKRGKGGGASHQRGMHFLARRAVVWFYTNWRLLSIKRRPPRQRSDTI